MIAVESRPPLNIVPGEADRSSESATATSSTHRRRRRVDTFAHGPTVSCDSQVAIDDRLISLTGTFPKVGAMRSFQACRYPDQVLSDTAGCLVSA